jgi:uncharacterized protein (TIGR02099 family)
LSPEWHHRLRRLRFVLTGLVTGVLVLFALAMAFGQLLLPLAARYPETVAAILSDKMHRPVSFAVLEGHWQGSGPLFVMRDVTLAPSEGGSALHLPQAALKLDFGAMLLSSRHFLNLRLSGLRIELLRDPDGAWHINGFAQGGNTQQVSLGNLSADLWLSDLRLDMTDGRTGHLYSLIADQLRLSKQGHQLRFGGSLRREHARGLLNAAGAFAEDGSNGRIYLAGSDMDIGGLIGDLDIDGYGITGGEGSFQTWLDWRKARVVRSITRADLNHLTVKSPARTVSVAALQGLFDLRRGADMLYLNWSGVDTGELAIAVQTSDGDTRATLAARQLDVAPLAPWAALAPQLSPDLAQWLGDGRPRGHLTDAQARWSQSAGLESAQATFNGLGIDPVGKLPGVDKLDGQVRGDAEAFSLSLPAQATTLRFPAVFRAPFVMSALSGDVVAWHDDAAWHLGTDAFDFRGQGFGGQARGELAFPDDGSRPFMEMYANLEPGDLPAAKLFWPHSMSEGTIKWLDRALVSGRIDNGSALVRGSLGDWPFHDNEGRFEGRAAISDMVFDYGTGWPRAEGMTTVASFVDNGMVVTASAGQSLGNKVDSAIAAIPDFADAQLDLDVSGTGTGASFMDFVRNSPVGSSHTDVLDKLQLGGTGTFGLKLLLPLKDAHGLVLAGTADLKDADLVSDEWKLRLDKMTGPLTFDSHGLKMGPMTTAYRGQPASLNVSIAGGTGDPKKVLDAHLQGRFSVAELLQGYDNLTWLGDLAKGRGQFDIGLDIAHRGDNDAVTQTLSVASDLRGVELTWPVPMKKAAAMALPLNVQLGLPVNGNRLDVSLGDTMRAHMRLADGADRPMAAAIVFGGTMPAYLPVKGLNISGHTQDLDVSGWVQYVVGSSGGEGPGLDAIDVHADQAEMFGARFGAMNIKAVPGAYQMNLHVDGPAIVGELSVPNTELRAHGITARMARLYWPETDDTAAQKQAAPAGNAGPGNGAVMPPAASTLTATPSGGALSSVAPGSLPPLHLQVSDLRLGKSKLGEARLETWPTAQGMHIDQLRSQSKSVQIIATGDWNGNETASRTHLQMDFSAEDLGAMLEALSPGGLITGGKTQARLVATWPGAPSAMSMANIDGTLRIDVSQGRIPDVQPGVGRLFGLISVVDLPRRMALDFGDVFGKGFSFDSINGDFRFVDGSATTDNLQIKGPAADISVTGRTGLRVRDYDQQVLVVPHVGNSLAVVGALAAGPVGAAAGLAVQGLLGKGLNRVASFRYHITGPWDKPVITLVEKRSLMPWSKAEPPIAAPVPSPTPASSQR